MITKGPSAVIRLLASPGLTLALLLVLAAAVGAGTFVESVRGTETARDLVYAAAWFEGLWVLFALNLLLALRRWFPLQARQTGFFLIHVAVLVILAGAALTRAFGTEGSLHLRRGEKTAVMISGAGTVPLPFALRLDDIVVRSYPGGVKMVGYESRVTLFDPVGVAKGRSCTLALNDPLGLHGYKIFQGSLDEDRQGTVLRLNHDPGKVPTYVGYAMISLGFVFVLARNSLRGRPGSRGQEGDAA